MRVDVPALGRGDGIGRSSAAQGMTPEALTAELCRFREIQADMAVQIKLLHQAIAPPLQRLVELTERLVELTRENSERSLALCERADRLDARGAELLVKGDEMNEQGKCIEHEVKKRVEQLEQGADV